MIEAWRIVKAKHADTALTGDGARRFGGRWNRPGTPMIYAASSVSLAMLEMLVHLSRADLLRAYVCFSVSLDAAQVETLTEDELPNDWRVSPPSVSTQQIGSDWAACQTSLALSVPSVVVPTERNDLINPDHTDFADLKIGRPEPVIFAQRLKRVGS